MVKQYQNWVKNSYRQGSLTVEAAVIVPFFLSIVVSMLMYSRIYVTYNAMEKAMADVALNVSNSGFVLKEIGFLGMMEKLDQQATETGLEDKAKSINQKFKTMTAEVGQSGADFGKIKKAAKRLSKVSGVNDFIGAINEMKMAVEGIMPVIQEVYLLVNELLSLFKTTTGSDIKAVILDKAARKMRNIVGIIYVQYAFKKYYDRSTLEKNYYIVGDISFAKSVFYAKGSEIEEDKNLSTEKCVNRIVAEYTMRIPYLFDLGIGDKELVNVVVVRGFSGKSDN